jgi:hypothetical protein
LTLVQDHIERGSDTCDFVATFFEKLCKIELTYAKAIDELCSSRTAKLARVFSTSTTEHIA